MSFGSLLSERKTAEDFCHGLVCSTLFEQLIRMKNAASAILLIIEGDFSEVKSQMHERAMKGALVMIASGLQLPVLFSKDVEDTAAFILLAAEQELRSSEERLPCRKRKPRLDRRRQAVRIVGSIPLVGPKRARALLKHFGTVRNVVQAEPKLLMSVEGIDEKIARELWEVATCPYIGVKSDEQRASLVLLL